MNDESVSLRHLLSTCKTVAVVGLSAEPDRPSWMVAAYMQAQGYRIVPVNPLQTQILGEKCYARLSDIPFAIDIVNVFRKTQDVLPIAQEAVQIRARCLWQQIGVENLEASQLAQEAGMLSVMNRCLKIEHQALMAR
jgi:uncharacterized protein